MKDLSFVSMSFCVRTLTMFLVSGYTLSMPCSPVEQGERKKSGSTIKQERKVPERGQMVQFSLVKSSSDGQMCDAQHSSHRRKRWLAPVRSCAARMPLSWERGQTGMPAPLLCHSSSFSSHRVHSRRPEESEREREFDGQDRVRR